MKPAQKLALGLVAALVLAVVSSGLTYLSASHSAELLEDLIAINLEQARAIYELEVALLEQGSLTAYYLLDGSGAWLDEMARREPFFEEWLQRVGEVGLDPEHRDLVRPINDAYRAYQASREQAVHLARDGDAEAARRVLLEEVRPRHEEVVRHCGALTLANKADIDTSVRAHNLQTRQVGIRVIVCLVSLVVLILGLAWMMFSGVFGPLRKLANDAREYAGDPGSGTAKGEVEVVGGYLKSLQSDVTEARTRLARSDRHLLDVEQMASLGRIAAGVAHEIRSPLTSLRLRLFSVQKSLGGERREDFEVMTEEVSRLDNIIRNFLEFSRPPDLRLQPCNVSLVLDKTLELLRYKMDLLGVRVERDEPLPLPPAWADSQQLRQVFLNLLNNALDVLPEDGRIHLTVREIARGARRFVTVVIADNGPGMPESAVERVFDPFFSTKQDGAGLGLWIARRIMAQHNGALDLVSTGERGTVFEVAIPIADEGEA